MRKIVFIGSSTEALPVAEKIASWLESLDVEPMLWNTVFELSDYTYEALDRVANRISGAIFIFSGDDIAIVREEETRRIRDNVLFEYGFFAGSLSRSRVIFVCPDKPKIPSDLFGITYLIVSENNEFTVKPQLQKWVDKLPMPSSEFPEPSVINSTVPIVADRGIDLRDVMVFHHPDGCRAASLEIRQRSQTFVIVAVDFVGENSPDYAGVYVRLNNENWEEFYENGRVRFDLKCEGEYAFQTIVFEPKSSTRTATNSVIRPYEIELAKTELSIDIPLSELSAERAKFAFMTELVFLFRSGTFQGNADIEISNLRVEVGNNP